MGITRLLRKKGFILSTLIVLIFLALGILGSNGVVSRLYIANGTDLMYFIGIGLAMAVIMSYTGYVSFGHAVFVGIGSFSTAYILAVLNKPKIMEYMAQHDRISSAMLSTYFIESILLASIIAFVVAVTVGYAVLRLRGAFFAIATIGLDYVVMYLIIYITSIISPFGGDELPNPNMGLTDMTFYWMHFILFIATIYTAYLVKISKFGYGLASIREDEDAAEVIGVDTFRYKIYAFALAAVLASLWGVASAFRKSYTTHDFSLLISIVMIVENVVGGLGTFIGPIVGAVIYYVLNWLLLTTAGQLALVILGAIVIVIVAFFPEGVVGLVKKKIPSLREWLE